MSIRFKCGCGRVLKAGDAAAGKQVACPACGKPVRIPTRSAPAEIPPTSPTEIDSDLTPHSSIPADVWDTLPAADSPPLPRQTIQPAMRSRQGWRVPVIALALVAALAGVCWVGYGLIANALQSDTAEIEENFVPLLTGQESSGESASDVTAAAASNPAIRLGNEFAEYARIRDVPAAIGMIDPELFHQRQMGPKGCYVSQRFKLSAKEVLSEAARYSLESTTSHGGKRLWQTIGTSRFDGQDGVMLRYYSEPRAPFEVFDEREVWEPVAGLLSFDEFFSIGPDLFSFPQYKGPAKGGHSQYRSEISRDEVVPWAAGMLPPRVGYVLLLLEGSGENTKVCDLVNVLGQQPLSRSCGPIFELGWTLYRGNGTPQPGLEKLIGSVFGDKPQRLVSYIISEKPSPEYWLLPNGRHRIRAVRLEEVSRAAAGHTFEINVGGENGPTRADLPTLVAQFREDFPNDLGADMAVVVIAMIPNEPRFYDSNTGQIMESAARLHERLGDPFLLYVLGLAAQAKGDLRLAREHLTAAYEAGFEAVDLHEFFIKEAVRAKDTEELKTAIARLNDYWDTSDRPKNDQLKAKFASRWRAYEKAQEPPPPTIADVMRSGAGAGRSRALSRPGPSRFSPGRGAGDVNRPTFGPGRGGGNEQPGGRPSRRTNAGQPSGFPGPGDGWVEIEITFTSRFDGKAALDHLMKELGVKNHSMRQFGKQATIRLGFTGPVSEVVDLIDFGKVSKVEQDKRRITVTAE